jgi:SAM-dependent methyltransferase
MVRFFDPESLPHRIQLLQIIEKYYPFETILDVGYGNGTDLDLLQFAYPEIKTQGYDPGYVQETKLPFPDKSFDIVFTDGVIMYLEDKRALIDELKRIAKRAIILMEHEIVDLEYTKRTKVTGWKDPMWLEKGYIYEIEV